MFNHRLGRLVVGGSVVVVGCGVVVVVGGIVVVEMTKNEQAGRRGWGLTLSFRLLFCFFFWEGRKKQKKVESVVVVQRMPFSSFWPGFHIRCLKGEKEEQKKNFITVQQDDTRLFRVSTQPIIFGISGFELQHDTRHWFYSGFQAWMCIGQGGIRSTIHWELL